MQKTMTLAQPYADKARASAKSSTDWDIRARKCAHQIVKAVCFRETAISAYKKAGNIPLAIIGFYYAVFHKEIAMLYADHATNPDELKKMKHRRLENLIQTKLINTGICNGEVKDILVKLRKYRELVNYEFLVPNEDFGPMMANFQSQVGIVFHAAADFIHKVSTEIQNQFSLRLRIQVTIGDSIGDDLYAAYLTSEDKKNVIDYLVRKGLTS